MTDTFHKTVEATLNLLPEVRWDRWAGTPQDCCVYGWITRPDGKFDFILLFFEDGEIVRFVTSSAKYSEDFNSRLGMDDDHKPCKRVENDFQNVQSIHLKPKFPTDGSINPAYHDLSIANEGENPYE